MRKFLLRTLLFICCSLCFSQSLQNKFIKGNIADKTTAVMDASDKERLWLTNEAIQFVIKNAEYLGEDRDLEGLALAAILSLPNLNGEEDLANIQSRTATDKTLTKITQTQKFNDMKKLTNLFLFAVIPLIYFAVMIILTLVHYRKLKNEKA